MADMYSDSRTMLTKNIAQLKQLVAEHVAADSITQGIYWDPEAMRGCFIGCLAHGDNPAANEEAYGLPVAVQRIAESIFEALPIDEAKKFFAALPDAVDCDGKDLGRVHWQFLAAELRNLRPQSYELQCIIDSVIAGLDLLSQGIEWPAAADVADAARAAARATAGATAGAAADAAGAAAGAADAARAAAWAAARDAAGATAWAAADAADAARAAAWAAADAARAAAWAAARDAAGATADAAGATAWAAAWAAARDAAGAAADAARARQRDLLLQLIKDAPLPSGEVK